MAKFFKYLKYSAKNVLFPEDLWEQNSVLPKKPSKENLLSNKIKTDDFFGFKKDYAFLAKDKVRAKKQLKNA